MYRKKYLAKDEANTQWLKSTDFSHLFSRDIRGVPLEGRVAPFCCKQNRFVPSHVTMLGCSLNVSIWPVYSTVNWHLTEDGTSQSVTVTLEAEFPLKVKTHRSAANPIHYKVREHMVAFVYIYTHPEKYRITWNIFYTKLLPLHCQKNKESSHWRYELCTQRRSWRYSANAMCIAGTSTSRQACQVSTEVSAVHCCLFLFLFML